MIKTCAHCAQQFEIPKEDLNFYDQISPTFNNERFQVPPPNLCPPCRQRLRASFRNERKLYKSKSALSGKEIISTYSPDKQIKVYDQDEWWSDKWDPLEYGIDFDFSKTLAEQMTELYKKIPHVSLVNINTENSYYTNYALNQKNCYLIFGSGDCEDCLYGKFVVSCKDCMDFLSTNSCELCYESIGSEKCYSCRFLQYCRACTDCVMIEDCTGCNNCIGCFGLRFKEYCVFNKQLTKTDYKKFAENYKVLTNEKIADLKTKFTEFKKPLPHIWAHIYASEDCTGDLISHCKNTKNSFNANNCEDCKYLYFTPNTLHSHDCTYNAPIGPEFCYNMISTVQLKDSAFNFLVWYGNNVYYSIECHSCSNVFACIGMKRKSYCILNKQYSKEAYEKLVAKIITHMQKTGEWGEFFKPEVAPYAYNESIAQEYFPSTKEEATAKGWQWKNEKPLAQEQKPQESQTQDDQILICKATNKPFKTVPQELTFYKKMGLPLPEKCPDLRHYDRMKDFKPLQLWQQTCSKCNKQIQTNYSQDRKEKIYCEECYLKEVY